MKNYIPSSPEALLQYLPYLRSLPKDAVVWVPQCTAEDLPSLASVFADLTSARLQVVKTLVCEAAELAKRRGQTRHGLPALACLDLINNPPEGVSNFIVLKMKPGKKRA